MQGSFKNSLLISSLLIIFFISSNNTFAQKARIYVGFSDASDVIENSTRLGLNDANKITLLQGLEASTFSSLKECKAVGVRFAYGLDVPDLNIDAQLTYGNKDKLKHAGRKRGVTAGWNEVLFTKPYAFDKSEDLYFGYSYIHTMTDKDPILLSSNDKTPQGLFIKIVNSDFFDGIVADHNNLLSQLIVEGNKKQLEKAVLLINSDFHKAPIAGSKVPVHLTFRNVGLSPVKVLNITTSINGVSTRQSITLPQSINAMYPEQVTVELPEPIAIPSDNKNKMEVTFQIDEVDGKDNALGRILRYQITPQNEGDTFERMVVFEQFSTENCAGCPNAEKMMHEAYESFGSEKALWIVHHIGNGEDFLTIKESKELTRFYPDNGQYVFAPAHMIDRGNCLTLAKRPSPIGMFPSNSRILLSTLKEAASSPGLAMLKISAGTTKTEDEYAILVKGKVSPYVNKEKVHLTVMVLESDIPQRNQQGLDPNEDFLHLFVPRKYFTPADGAKIEIDPEGNFTYYATRNYPIVDDDEKYTIVAFVHYWDANNYENNEILNASKIPLTSNYLATEQPLSENELRPVVKDNSIYIIGNTENNPIEVFSLDGQRVKNYHLNNGIYIVRTKDKTGKTIIFKVNVKQ